MSVMPIGGRPGAPYLQRLLDYYPAGDYPLEGLAAHSLSQYAAGPRPPRWDQRGPGPALGPPQSYLTPEGGTQILPRPDPPPRIDFRWQPSAPAMFTEPAADLEEMDAQEYEDPRLWRRPYQGLLPDQLPWPSRDRPGEMRPPAQRPSVY